MVYDHTSVLKLIEWRWKLAPLTARDASDDIQNLAHALQFDNPNAGVPQLPQPLPPFPLPCPGGNVGFGSSAASEWQGLLNAGAFRGWPVTNF